MPSTTAIRMGLQKINILSTQHTLFIAYLIRTKLEKFHFTVKIQTEAINFDDDLYIVISPQAFDSMPVRYWAFQMEQSISSRWFTPAYFKKLEAAELILDYSIKNLEFLQNNGFKYEKLFYCPISTFPNYPAFLEETELVSSKSTEKIYDVLFYGDSYNERRKDFLKRLSEKFTVKIVNDDFGPSLYRYLKESRLVVNIHYYENALLETTRIHECLSFGIPVISEESADMDAHEYLNDLVIFTPAGDIEAMVNAVSKALTEEPKLVSTVLKGANSTKHHGPFSYFFNRVLLAKGLINYIEFREKRPFYEIDISQAGTCLTLPETYERHLSFIEQDVFNFAVFNGLRSEIGWIGCGMSFKFLIEEAKSQGWEYVIICEDDVEFKKNHRDEVLKILEYLKNFTGVWHIFCGLIAHLHTDAQIEKIDTFRNTNFIHINKMTSMVFNIYHRSCFDKILSWNENDSNATTNTIDRLLESTQDLKVITTFPFLVGHREDRYSTLWGIKNTGYNDLITSSANLLEEKVKQFNELHKADK